MTDVPKNGNGSDEEAKMIARIARNPLAVVLIAWLVPGGMIGAGTSGLQSQLREAVSTLHDVKASVQELKITVAGLERAKPDERLRALELRDVEKKALDDAQNRRLEALEARAR